MEVNKIIAVPNKSEWASKKPFALLVECLEKYYTGRVRLIHRRLGLVELGNSERLQKESDNWIIIGSAPQDQYKVQIEVPPKK